MEGPEEKRTGVFATLGRLLRTFAAIAENRTELFLLEWHEERWRLFEALILAGIVLVLALMTLMVATVTVVVICVNNHQLGVVVAMGLVYLVATLGCYWQLRNRMKAWEPFAGTLAEIKKDKECLDGKN
jgi:uncharacterized membrane protein YqjE